MSISQRSSNAILLIYLVVAAIIISLTIYNLIEKSGKPAKATPSLIGHAFTYDVHGRDTIFDCVELVNDTVYVYRKSLVAIDGDRFWASYQPLDRFVFAADSNRINLVRIDAATEVPTIDTVYEKSTKIVYQ